MDLELAGIINTISYGATTLRITTFIIMTLTIKAYMWHSALSTLSLTMLCHYAECHYTECHVLFIVMLNVVISCRIFDSFGNPALND